MDSVDARELINRGIVIAIVVMISGCIIPISSNNTTGEIEPSQLQSLVGNTKNQVQSKLGEPTHSFVPPHMGESYYVYSGFTSSRLDVGFFDVMDAHCRRNHLHPCSEARFRLGSGGEGGENGFCNNASQLSVSQFPSFSVKLSLLACSSTDAGSNSSTAPH